VNNHAANLWKDYYLDHKPRIDRLVEKHGESSDKSSSRLSVKKPPLDIQPPVNQPPKHRQGTPSTASSRARSKPGASSQKLKLQKTSGTRRKTINSLTTHTAAYGSSMPAPNAEVRVPDPPSRSPTPPTRVIPSAHGNRYTDEDKQYFIKFISWRLKSDPTLIKAELCEQLARKVPPFVISCVISSEILHLNRHPITPNSHGHRIGMVGMTWRTKYSLLHMQHYRITPTTLVPTSMLKVLWRRATQWTPETRITPMQSLARNLTHLSLHTKNQTMMARVRTLTGTRGVWVKAGSHLIKQICVWLHDTLRLRRIGRISITGTSGLRSVHAYVLREYFFTVCNSDYFVFTVPSKILQSLGRRLSQTP
jgi:hypothetical protein